MKICGGRVTKITQQAEVFRRFKARGAATISNLTWGKFLTSSVEVDSTLLQQISEEELKVQYREYVRRLERVGQDLANKDLSDIDLLELILKP